MAPVPKKKHTKSRTGKRRRDKKAKMPNLVKCKSCGEFKKSHMLCENCGEK